MKSYMVIETFLPGCKDKVYKRFREQGRMLPVGLEYQESWLEHQGNRCFQLMSAKHDELFEEWIENWNDLVQFEVIALGEKPGT